MNDYLLAFEDTQPAAAPPPAQGGLGTVILAALVKQLGADTEVMTLSTGLGAAITRGSAHVLLPQAA
jgi:two-component sensor histidine kinase